MNVVGLYGEVGYFDAVVVGYFPEDGPDTAGTPVDESRLILPTERWDIRPWRRQWGVGYGPLDPRPKTGVRARTVLWCAGWETYPNTTERSSYRERLILPGERMDSRRDGHSRYIGRGHGSLTHNEYYPDRSNSNRAPPSRPSVTETVQPCAFAMSATIESPNPVPPSLDVTPCLNTSSCFSWGIPSPVSSR